MSTIIIITPPPKQQNRTSQTDQQISAVEQLKSDAKILEDAGFKVQVFQTEK